LNGQSKEREKALFAFFAAQTHDAKNFAKDTGLV